MSDREKNRFSARAARYARVGANVGGVAAKIAATRFFGIGLDRGKNAIELAAALGGRNVAMAQFETTNPEAPLAITARADGSEPIVLALGDEEFPMDPGWP